MVSFNKNIKHKHIIDSTKAEVKMRIVTNQEITRLMICLQFPQYFESVEELLFRAIEY